MKLSVWYFIFLLGLVLPSVAYGSFDCTHLNFTEADLFRLIFNKYSKETRPKRNVTDPIVVEMGMRLYGIKEFIEPENRLILDGYLDIVWFQDMLQWRDYPFFCVRDLLVNAYNLWVPDLGILNGDSEIFDFSKQKASIRNTGQIGIYPNGQVAVRCDLDLTLFPFDHQLCEINIQSRVYSNKLLKLQTHFRPFMKVDYLWSENGQWELVDNETLTTSETLSGDVYNDHVHFRMLLRRKSLYYYINVIIPSIIIAVAQLATFMLPVEDVIKVHISFTCLLAYSVFQTMIIGDMPKSSDRIPLLSIYIDLQMVYIGGIALLGEGVVFAIIRKAAVAKVSPPLWSLNFAKAVAGFMCLTDNLPTSLAIHSASASATTTATNNTQEARSSSKILTLQRREQWIFLAEFVERFNMWLYTTAIVVTPAVMFTFAPAKQLLNNDIPSSGL